MHHIPPHTTVARARRWLWLLPIFLLLQLACAAGVFPTFGGATAQQEALWRCPTPTPKPYGPDQAPASIKREYACKCTTDPDTGAESCDTCYTYYGIWEQEYGPGGDLLRGEPPFAAPFPAPTTFAIQGTAYVFGMRVQIAPFYATVSAYGTDQRLSVGAEELEIYHIDIAWQNEDETPWPIDYASQLRLRQVVRDDGRREQAHTWTYDSRVRAHSDLPRPPATIPVGTSQVTIPIAAPPGDPFLVELIFRSGDRARAADGTTPTPGPTTPPPPDTPPTPAPFQPHPEDAERNSYTVQWLDTTYETLEHGDGECAYGPGATTPGLNGPPWHQDVPLRVDAPPLQRAIVAAALAEVGRPYIWGGVNSAGIGDCLSPLGCFPAGYHRDFPGGTIGFDCSGLMIWAYAQNGIDIPWRTTFTQFPNLNDPLTVGGLQPADMGYYGVGQPTHVGMLVGDVGTNANDPTPDGTWDFVHAPAMNTYVRVEYDYFNTYEPYAGLRGYRTPRGMALYPHY